MKQGDVHAEHAIQVFDRQRTVILVHQPRHALHAEAVIARIPLALGQAVLHLHRALAGILHMDQCHIAIAGHIDGDEALPRRHLLRGL